MTTDNLPETLLEMARFEKLSSEWKAETGHFSMMTKRFRHHSYQAILAMGKAAIPLILKELRREPDRWFNALEILSGKNPAKHAETFYECVDDWIAWGYANEYI